MFRKNALQSLSNPEQLDELVTITKPLDWLFMLVLVLLFVAFVMWSIFGEVQFHVEARGIFLTQGGMRTAVANKSGIISGISELTLHSLVSKGQVLAYIEPNTLQQQLQNAENYLQQLKLQQASKELIFQAEFQRNQLQTEWRSASTVLSPVAGRLVELMANDGDFVSEAMPVIGIEAYPIELHVVLFIPPMQSVNSIMPGMSVHLFPGAESKDSADYLVGRVRLVDQFPATDTRLSNLIHNTSLEHFFSEKGPPFVVDVELLHPPNQANQYVWSNAELSQTQVNSGLLCSALITTRKLHPIQLLFSR